MMSLWRNNLLLFVLIIVIEIQSFIYKAPNVFYSRIYFSLSEEMCTLGVVSPGPSPVTFTCTTDTIQKDIIRTGVVLS